jgi:hypothetical protein
LSVISIPLNSCSFLNDSKLVIFIDKFVRVLKSAATDLINFEQAILYLTLNKRFADSNIPSTHKSLLIISSKLVSSFFSCITEIDRCELNLKECMLCLSRLLFNLNTLETEEDVGSPAATIISEGILKF